MRIFISLEYVMGIYGLTLLVTLFVVVVILGIRLASKERIKPSTANIEPYVKTEEVTL